MQQPTNSPDLDDALAQAHSDVTTDMGRMEAKIAALLSALGLPLAVLAAVIPGHSLPTAVTVLIGLAGAGLVAGVVTALLALRPIGVHAQPRGSFLRWASCTTADEVLDDLAEDHRAERLIRRSGLLRRKFRVFRIAIHISIAAVLILALALAVALAG
ncbi:Pycsar system effector family protein [Kitasatospora sp. NPDC059800]|uniref:Pycsar system effector family protein n=1 Tax=Kitasatospora sp. NPDC059800 TaxID=3346951 RepID=UPI003662E72F